MLKKPKTYSVQEAADIVGTTRRTFYNYIKAGQIKAVKYGRTWEIREEDLKYFLDHGLQENYFINNLQK